MKKLNEGRKPIIRSLPPLAKACAAFSGFRTGENRTERIYKLLSVLIQRFRQTTPRPFYSMREAVTFFGVSITTVSRVYHRLDREGMLTLVRSSQTMITARAPRPRFAIRGVVCMPIWMPAFLYFLDWRKWFSQLEEELSHYHFALEPIFFKGGENITPAFVDRILRFNPDYVLWNWPAEVDLTALHSIADAGVPLVSIQNTMHPFPGRVYRTSYDAGMRRGLKEWEQSGRVDNIVIPWQKMFKKERTTWNIKPVLGSCSLPSRFDYFFPEKKETLLDFLQRLAPGRRTGVIFDDHLIYARLCAVAPKEMLEFIRRHRVMVMRQITLHLPIPKPPADMTVDALIFPWKKLARRIAMDLSKAKGTPPTGHSLLEAEWRPQIPLSEVVQTVFNE